MNAPQMNAKPGRIRGKTKAWINWLVGPFAFALTVALLWGQENWRGRQAWDNCRRELASRGKAVEWPAYIPPQVPDDQNLFKAPEMQSFIKDQGPNVLANHFQEAQQAVQQRATPELILAELTVISPGTPSLNRDSMPAFDFDDSAGRQAIALEIERHLGPRAFAAAEFTLTATPVDNIKPLHLIVRSKRELKSDELSEWISGSVLQPRGTDSFRLVVHNVVWASDYLTRTDALRPDFHLIRQALKRPYARIDGDYQRPFKVPTPNLSAIRDLAQTLSQRAQCFLLLGRPDEALMELTFLGQTRRFLISPPENRHMSLVSTMVDVAINGLYVSVIQDGLRLGAWGEPQLTVIEEDLAQRDLLLLLANALRTEVAAVVWTFQTTRYARVFDTLAAKPKFSVFDLLPRGWIDHNLVVYTDLMERYIDSVDLSNARILPHQMEQSGQTVERVFTRFSPYNFIAKAAIPNVLKAAQTVARTQTSLNQARIACALERYRLLQGQYPADLDLLPPRFIDKIPRDIISGNPPHYALKGPGAFQLSSNGWNAQDAAGDPGDWVWNCSLSR